MVFQQFNLFPHLTVLQNVALAPIHVLKLPRESAEQQARALLDRVRADYNGVRLHAGVGYITPDDEHSGRGDGIRQARRDGLAAARQARITYRRTTTQEPR